MKKIIILGGTGLARDFLQKIMVQRTDIFCFYSLKNIGCKDFLPTIDDESRGKIVAGGFAQYDGKDGTDSEAGFLQFCKKENLTAIVVAVSPFATTMATTASEVAKKLSLPLFYLQPAPWDIADDVKNKKIILAKDKDELLQLFLHHWTDDAGNIAGNIIGNSIGNRNIFLALGGQDGGFFLSGLAKKLSGDLKKNTAENIPADMDIEQPMPPASMPIIFWRAIYQPNHVVDSNFDKKISVKIILMPPQDLPDEKKFLKENNIGMVIGKNSGGHGNKSKNKILAARACDVPILLLSPAMVDEKNIDKNNFTSSDQLLTALSSAF